MHGSLLLRLLRMIRRSGKRSGVFRSSLTPGVRHEAKITWRTYCAEKRNRSDRLRNMINVHQSDTGGAAISTHDRGVSPWRDGFH
jgi:hypothetical protein